MGEIADMMIDGTLDYETGELIDSDSPGYPRLRRASPKKWRCKDCDRGFRSRQGLAEHRRVKHEEVKP